MSDRMLNNDDLEGMARRIANNAINSAEIQDQAALYCGHLFRDHVYAEALQMLKTVVLHERLQGLRTFTMYRRNVPDETHNADQKNPPDQPQFEGVVFSDGSVAIRWLTAKRSTAIWASMDDMLAIHGHPEYGSVLVWHGPMETT